MSSIFLVDFFTGTSLVDRCHRLQVASIALLWIRLASPSYVFEAEFWAKTLVLLGAAAALLLGCVFPSTSTGNGKKQAPLFILTTLILLATLGLYAWFLTWSAVYEWNWYSQWFLQHFAWRAAIGTGTAAVLLCLLPLAKFVTNSGTIGDEETTISDRIALVQENDDGTTEGYSLKFPLLLKKILLGFGKLLSTSTPEARCQRLQVVSLVLYWMCLANKPFSDDPKIWQWTLLIVGSMVALVTGTAMLVSVKAEFAGAYKKHRPLFFLALLTLTPSLFCYSMSFAKSFMAGTVGDYKNVWLLPMALVCALTLFCLLHVRVAALYASKETKVFVCSGIEAEVEKRAKLGATFKNLCDVENGRKANDQGPKTISGLV